MNRLSMVGDLWMFLRHRKKFWLLPIVIVLLALGVILVVGASSALAPFIYTIF
jgi:competence protein ComGC